MEDKKNNNMWVWIVVAIIIIGILVFLAFRNNEVVVSNTTTPVAQDNALEPDSTLDISDATSTTTGAKPVFISYAEALVKYADRRIQFGKDCQVSKINSSVTYKDNTGIMLDNRSSFARTIKIGTNYSVKAYGFRIVVLPDVYMKAKTILVDCDKQQNVATILIQE